MTTSHNQTQSEGTVDTMTDERSITAADRCDRCGAQAYLILGVGGSELLFCGHHAREHSEAALQLPSVRVITDDTAKVSA